MKKTTNCVICEATCQDCDYQRRAEGSNHPSGGAALHAKSSGHRVVSTVTLETLYDGTATTEKNRS